ncbi:MAG: right-handed parallel beta-helix repeat-containing protein, partial [Candidatus Thorarchaeota archaeon]
MVRKSIPLMIIIVLSLQSILIITSFSHAAGEGDLQVVTARMIPSQGSRLDSADYTNHVPILIDEVSDFALFGFPGAGTQNDPYVISSLNITWDYDWPSIQINNIDAYFTIVDCYIKQGAINIGIHLENTSHATIEHVTIESNSHGVVGINSNDTIVNSNHITGSMLAAMFTLSHDCRISNNYLESQYCCYLLETNAFNLENNVYNATGSGAGFLMEASYNTNSFLDQIFSEHEGVHVSDSVNFSMSGALVQSYASGIQSDSVYGVIIDNCTIESETGGAILTFGCPNIKIQQSYVTGSVGGLYIEDSDSPIIDRCTISTENENGVNATRCPDLIVTDTTVTSLLGTGINIGDSNYTQILGNSIQADVTGIYVDNSFQATAEGNIVQQGLVGIYFTYCEQSLITSNDLSGCWMGGGMQWCNNSFITHNYLYNMEMGGIGSNDNFNITITDNTMDGTGRGGISLHAEDLAYGVEISRNQITNITWWAIQVSDHSDIVINNNVINNLEGDTLWFDEGMGIRMQECNNVEIEGNHIWDATTGMAIASCVNVTIESNTIEEMILLGIGGVNNVNSNITDNIIENCEVGGITLGMFVDTGQTYRGPPSGTISGNSLSGCGFVTDFDTFSQFAAHTYVDNTVNSKPLYYGSNVSDLTIDADLYGQIIVFNCSDVNITSHGYIFDSVITHVLFSSRILVDGFHSLGRYSSFFAYQSQNLTINNYLGEYLDTYEQYVGYYFPSVHILDSTDILIENSFLLGNENNTGIGIRGSLRTTIDNCDIFGMARAVWIDDSQNCTILGNRFTKMTWGIYSHYDSGDNEEHMSIIDNEIRYGSSYGIYIDSQGADNCLVQGNTIESCGTGVHIEAGENWTIQNNTIRWNYDYGIRLVDSIGANVSYNILGLSGTEDGYDNLAQNWDDNVSTGNWWSDYTPPGVYPISGGAGAQDRYPMQYIVTEPIVNQALDVQYAEGTTGNTITWIPFDDALRDWQVTIGGVDWIAEAWKFDTITVNIDGLDYGTHTLEITIWDVDLNSITDEVIINVFDGTLPTISNVADGWAFVDAEGQVLTWEVSDAHPDE